jgi:hypothetical protein
MLCYKRHKQITTKILGTSTQTVGALPIELGQFKTMVDNCNTPAPLIEALRGTIAQTCGCNHLVTQRKNMDCHIE